MGGKLAIVISLYLVGPIFFGDFYSQVNFMVMIHECMTYIIGVFYLYHPQQNSKSSSGATSSTSTATCGESSSHRNISSPCRSEPDSPPPNKSPRHSPPDSPKPCRVTSSLNSAPSDNITVSTKSSCNQLVTVTCSTGQSKTQSSSVNTSPKTSHSELKSSHYSEYNSGLDGYRATSSFGKLRQSLMNDFLINSKGYAVLL